MKQPLQVALCPKNTLVSFYWFENEGKALGIIRVKIAFKTLHPLTMSLLVQGSSGYLNILYL